MPYDCDPMPPRDNSPSDRTMDVAQISIDESFDDSDPSLICLSSEEEIEEISFIIIGIHLLENAVSKDVEYL
jgi:hypothetical protein